MFLLEKVGREAGREGGKGGWCYSSSSTTPLTLDLILHPSHVTLSHPSWRKEERAGRRKRRGRQRRSNPCWPTSPSASPS